MGTWIEISLARSGADRDQVVPYVGTWIEIHLAQPKPMFFHRRSLRGNVDRNSNCQTIVIKSKVVPYVGTWIEIRYTWLHEVSTLSRSLRGNVDRNISQPMKGKSDEGRSLRGNVDRNNKNVHK